MLRSLRVVSSPIDISGYRKYLSYTFHALFLQFNTDIIFLYIYKCGYIYLRVYYVYMCHGCGGRRVGW